MDLSREELVRLDQQRPGSQTIDLNTAFFGRFTGKKIDLADYNGRKVVVRGRLESAKGTPRVMIVTLQGVGSGCS